MARLSGGKQGGKQGGGFFDTDLDLIQDPRFKYRNGNPVLNQFGGSGTMVHNVARTDEGWGIEAMNGVIFHGLNHFNFTTIPANPISDGDGFAAGMWAISVGVSPQLRIHYGVDLKLLKSFDNWKFSMWYCALPNTHPAINQNLFNPMFINLADINIQSGTKRFSLRIMDATQKIELFPLTSITNVTIDTNWHYVELDFSIPSTSKPFMNRFGSERAKLEIWAYNGGHPRYLVYDVHCKPR